MGPIALDRLLAHNLILAAESAPLPTETHPKGSRFASVFTGLTARLNGQRLDFGLRLKSKQAARQHYGRELQPFADGEHSVHPVVLALRARAVDQVLVERALHEDRRVGHVEHLSAMASSG